MEKIKISAVSYLNTRPFLYGLMNSRIKDTIDLSLDFPSGVAEKLISGKAIIGLVPTVSIHEISGVDLISNYCIASDGEVGSVCIYGQVPIKEITHVYLDYQSRTSGELAKILLKDFWKVTPVLLPASEGYEQKIVSTIGGLIIGDRALRLKKSFKYCYDLGKGWKDFTGLPFVFACWVANRTLPKQFIEQFNSALQIGTENITEVVTQNQPEYPGVDVNDYLTNKIHFQLEEKMYQAMDLFLTMVTDKMMQTTR